MFCCELWQMEIIIRNSVSTRDFRHVPRRPVLYWVRTGTHDAMFWLVWLSGMCANECWGARSSSRETSHHALGRSPNEESSFLAGETPSWQDEQSNNNKWATQFKIRRTVPLPEDTRRWENNVDPDRGRTFVNLRQNELIAKTFVKWWRGGEGNLKGMTSKEH